MKKETDMNQHEKIREQMPLATAGALDDNEERELSRHLSACGDCSAEFEQWRELGAGLRRMPTPQAPSAMVERVRATLMAQVMARAEQRANRRTMAWLVLFAWTTTLATWPILRLISQGAETWLNVSFVHTYHILIGFTVLSWVGAAVAAGVLGARHRFERRLA
nr:zf-HC2 domain-containing protein [Candidatus Acidoferrales bacterium]